MVGVEIGARRADHRVDLDGVDVRGALGERDRDIVPVPRTDDEGPAGFAVEVLVHVEVERLVVDEPVDGGHRLVG